MRPFPRLVCQLVTCHDAWIVGGAADPSGHEPRDYDVVVAHHHWRQATQLIPRDAAVNSFGGWKCLSEGAVVDVWPDDLNTLLTNHFVKHAWHPRSGTRLVIDRGQGESNRP